MELTVYIAVAITIFYLIYHYVFKIPTFWEELGVKSPKTIPIFGNTKDVIFLKLSFGDFMKKMYLEYMNEPMVGIYSMGRKILLLRDLDLIKDVLIKDFSIFSDRGLSINVKAEPLTENLLFLEPEKWRTLRNKLSPVFTSGKLKEMFYILIECAQDFSNFMEKNIIIGEPIEIRDLTSKFTTDVIGSCAFGLKMNAISETDSEFRKRGKKIFEMDWWKILKFRLKTSFPGFFDLFWRIFYDKEETEFFVNCIKETIEYRKKNNIRRHDFVDLLRDIQDNPDQIKDIDMTDTLVAAQAFVFFGAGFETSSTTMSNALYELAQHHDVQDKLREEINNEFMNNGGTLKYESIKNMKYMHKVFQETLRKYPPGHILSRKSSAPYTFNGTNISIPKGQVIIISTYGIHYDPSIYSNPNKFDPERFEDEAVQARHPMSFLAFGDGPRNCIGARFAVNQTKVGLAYMLYKYKVDICEKTMIPYENNPAGFLLMPKHGIFLKFCKIN